MVLRISLVYGGLEFRSRVTAEMIEAAKSKRAEERGAARRDAEATLRHRPTSARWAFCGNLICRCRDIMQGTCQVRHAEPVIAAILCALLIGSEPGVSAPQAPAVRSVDEKILRGYVGVYEWEPNAFVYIQMWSEFSGKNQLVAFDESGEVRTLYPMGGDRFFAGPGAAVPTAMESRIDFQRNGQRQADIADMAQRRRIPAHGATRRDREARRRCLFKRTDSSCRHAYQSCNGEEGIQLLFSCMAQGLRIANICFPLPDF